VSGARWVFGTLALGVALAGARQAGAEPTSDVRSVDLAFVLLSEPRAPKPQDVERAFASFALPGQILRQTPGKPTNATKRRGGADALAFDLGGGRVAFVALMPVAVPNHEADDAVRFSVSALGGRWKLPPHKAHLVVSMPGVPPSAEALSTFTSVVAAVVEASPAVGVYWGNAGATHDPKFFLEIARERGASSRVPLWSGVSIAREPDGRLSFLSLGMRQLALPELWLVVPASKADEAIATLFDLLASVVKRGRALPEGDTVGPTDRERWPVHYVPSPVDPTAKVWRVELK
jgi:hypothetical protein